MDKKTHYHGLGKDLLVKAVDSLDSPLEIYKKSEDDFIIVTELQDKNGSKIIAPIRINGKGSYNNVYLDENHILSVYGKDNLDYYLKKNNFEKIFEKKGTTLNERDDFPNISDSSNNIISEDAENTTPTYSISEDSQGNVLSDETNNFFRYAQTRDENGRLKPFYHGTARGDRVGYYFDPNKATSGPMAYFTDNKEIGENYARDKNDTSLAYDSQYDSYETQFRVERNGKNMSVVEIWDTLSASEKNAITEKAKHVTMDDDWENVIYSEETETGLGNFDSREMRAHRGNALHVLVDSWLTDGNIYGEEQKFLEVLRLVGISDAQYMNPNKREEKVYEVYLNVTNPLKTEEIDQQFVDELHEWLDETDLSVYQKETANADMWDKNSINPYDWLDKLQDDVNNGTTHAWTSIPDAITGYLKEKGYDGIFDIGGKGGGMGHQVVIPFYSNQIKEITNQSPTEESDDIRYSISKDEDLAPVRTDIYGRDIALEAPVREDIAPVQGAAVEDMAPVRTDIGTPKTWDMSEEGMEEYIGSGNANDQYEPTPGSLDQKIKTVKDRNNAKLENYKVELKNKTKLRDEVHSAYNSEIAELQNSIERLDKLRVDAMASYNKSITELREEYEGKKNKDTKTANAILQKIERMKVSKREVDTDYDNQIYDLKGKIEDKKRHRDDSDANYEKAINDIKGRIDKMSTKEFKTAEQRMTKQQEHQMEMGELMGDTSTWVDKKMGISYKVNTLRRNLRDIVRDENGNRDIKKADAIYDALQGRYNHNEAALKREANKIKKVFADMDITKEEDAYIQMLGEYRHNPDTSLLADDMTEFFEKHKKNINEAKVDKIIEMSRELYDGLFQRLNEVLREQGMKEVEYRKGYFPHFTEDKQSRLAKLLNWKTKNNDIPTDIAGLTENFTPNRSWQSFNKHRTGDDTDYSFKKGLDTYVAGSLDWIYHIDDIQRRRAFENEVRYRHSDKGVQEKIEKIRSNEEYDADEMQEQIDMVYKEKQNPLNNFISDFRTGTNILAGKKNTMDRGMEEATNRHIYSTMTNISNRVTANMVVGSVSSALTNFIPITQSWGEVSPVTSLRAMRDTMHSFARDDGTVEKSDFLTNRLKPVENLYQSGWDKILDKAGLMMEIADDITAQTVWRSKYLENMADGMSEAEAIKSADQFSENVMAGRSRGNMPTIFDAKNPLIKIFTAFQLEVNNQYGYMFKDLPQDIKKKTLGNLTMAYGKMYVGAYVYNQLYSWMTGRDAAFDPIGIVEDVLRDFGVFGDDEEEDALDALLGLTDSIVEEMPFVGGFLGGGRVPISSALPYEGLYEAFKGTAEDIVEGNVKSLTKEWLKPVVYVALPGGGGQIKKTVEGLSMFSDDFPVAGSYTDSGNLRFQVPDDFPTRLQAAVFGQWASDEAQQYLDEGRTPLKADKVPIAKAVGGYDAYMEYKEYVKQLESDKDEDGNSVPGSKKAKVIDYLSGLDVDYGMKLIMFKNEYPKDDTYDEQIKEYLKSRTDITSKERKSILAELGFE